MKVAWQRLGEDCAMVGSDLKGRREILAVVACGYGSPCVRCKRYLQAPRGKIGWHPHRSFCTSSGSKNECG
jgi:hypothetical protein